MKKDNETRTYEIVTETATYRVEVPTTWKVTIGPILPPSNKRGFSSNHNGTALRFYESEKVQRAMFRDVISYRDLSLPIMKKYVQIKGHKEFYVDNKANISHEEQIVKEKWEKLD